MTPTSTPRHSKQSDEKVQFSELPYRRLFETARDGILLLNANSGKITGANPFLEDLLGYSVAELLGKQLWEIGAFKDIVDSKKAFLELRAKGYIRYADLPLQTKDKRLIDVEFIGNAYTVGSQKVIQCNIRDITVRKKIEEAVEARNKELEGLTKAQEETKRAMLNVLEDLEQAKSTIEIEKVKDEAMLSSIGEGLIAVDIERKIMVVNKAAERMLGWKPGEALGRKLTSFSLEDEAGRPTPAEQRPVYLALAGGTTINSTLFYTKKDKTRLPLAITVTPIKLGRKKIGAIIIFRDVTRELEVDRAKSEFVSLASHQLRTPLGIVKWYLEALENDDHFTTVPSTIRKYLGEIHTSNERVLSLVRDLLSVSRIDQGRIKNSPQLVSPIPHVTELVERMQIMARKKGITLSVVVRDQPMPAIMIDVLRFQEVIENLIANALEYTLASGIVSVAVSTANGMFLLRVQDTGIGISKADQKRLFTKFFRSEKAIQYNPEGSGLGLYLVKSYVEGWGGNVAVNSVEGEGSTFTLSLPLSEKNNGEGGDLQ